MSSFVAVIALHSRQYLEWLEQNKKEGQNYVWVFNINIVRGRRFHETIKLGNYYEIEGIDEILEYISKHTSTLKNVMHLYVWEDVLSDFTSGIMFAYAENADNARLLIEIKLGYFPEELSKEPREIKNEEGFFVRGGM